MFRKSLKCLLLAGFFLTLSFFSTALAQESLGSLISAEVSPTNYGPNESVIIKLSSYSDNLDTANISWVVNERTASSGIGNKDFSMTSGALGTETKVVVNITLPEGVAQKTVYIRPDSSVLLWEGVDSHVPPFYKGKAIPSKDSMIKVVAMPEIRLGSATLDPKSLVYNWKQDYSNDTAASGYGKNYFTYINDYLETSNIIEVTASTTSGERSATVSVNISATEPELLFYKADAELGTLWEQELTDGYVVKNGDIILAEPYFISPKDIRRPDLVFSWFVNGAQINVPNFSKNFLPLGIEEGASGTSTLKLEIENANKIFQVVEKEIILNF